MVIKNRIKGIKGDGGINSITVQIVQVKDQATVVNTDIAQRENRVHDYYHVV